MRRTKKLLLIIPFLLIPLHFSHAEEFVDSAEILNKKPIIERLYAPADSCGLHGSNSENAPKVNAGQGDISGKVVFGALIGGLFGAQLSDNPAPTALGAIFGAQLASGGEITGEKVLGVLAGGLVGSQFGKGKGRQATTAIGALVGAAIADGHVSRNKNEYTRTCGNKVVSKRVITSYEIEYSYNGFIHTGTVAYKPGRYIDVVVNVEVIEDLTVQ